MVQIISEQEDYILIKVISDLTADDDVLGQIYHAVQEIDETSTVDGSDNQITVLCKKIYQKEIIENINSVESTFADEEEITDFNPGEEFHDGCNAYLMIEFRGENILLKN